MERAAAANQPTIMDSGVDANITSDLGDNAGSFVQPVPIQTGGQFGAVGQQPATVSGDDWGAPVASTTGGGGTATGTGTGTGGAVDDWGASNNADGW